MTTFGSFPSPTAGAYTSASARARTSYGMCTLEGPSWRLPVSRGPAHTPRGLPSPARHAMRRATSSRAEGSPPSKAGTNACLQRDRRSATPQPCGTPRKVARRIGDAIPVLPLPSKTSATTPAPAGVMSPDLHSPSSTPTSPSATANRSSCLSGAAPTARAGGTCRQASSIRANPWPSVPPTSCLRSPASASSLPNLLRCRSCTTARTITWSGSASSSRPSSGKASRSNANPLDTEHA